MVIDSASGVELLRDVGFDVRVAGHGDLEIAVDGPRWLRYDVRSLNHSPSPAELDQAQTALRARDAGVLFVVPRAGRALRARAADTRVAYAAVVDGVVGLHGEERRAAETATARTGASRVSWVRFAVLRALALDPARVWTQSGLGRRLRVSHVAVGKQFLALAPLLERTPHGWRAIDPQTCADRFLNEYPGARGLATYWTATSDLFAQAQRAEEVAREHDVAIAFSGDIAADIYAPWRRPTRVLGYVTEMPELESYGFAQVRTADATLELRIPQDPTILPMSRAVSPAGRVLADPLVTAWDLSRTRGGDVPDAVARLASRAIEERLWS